MLQNRFSPPETKGQTKSTAAVLGIDFAMQKSGLAVSTGGIAPRPLKVSCKYLHNPCIAAQVLQITMYMHFPDADIFRLSCLL